MKRLPLFLIIAVLTPALAYSQSSGNFTYGSNSQTERCVLNNDNTGTISGGSMCGLTARGRLHHQHRLYRSGSLF